MVEAKKTKSKVEKKTASPAKPKVQKKPAEAKPNAVAKKATVPKVAKKSAKVVIPKAPETEGVCEDRHCAVHKHMSVRGRVFIGTVIKDKMNKSIVVEWPRRVLIRKYERYAKKRSRVSAHNPKCITAKVGDRVKIAECRPISKTKKFVVVEVLK